LSEKTRILYYRFSDVGAFEVGVGCRDGIPTWTPLFSKNELELRPTVLSAREGGSEKTVWVKLPVSVCSKCGLGQDTPTLDPLVLRQFFAKRGESIKASFHCSGETTEGGAPLFETAHHRILN